MLGICCLGEYNVRMIPAEFLIMPGRHTERLKDSFIACGPVALVEIQPGSEEKPPAHEFFERCQWIRVGGFLDAVFL